jgi:hypothetical protein
MNLQLEIRDLSGKRVQMNALGNIPPGEHQLEFYFENSIPNGMYVVQLFGEGIHLARKVILQR